MKLLDLSFFYLLFLSIPIFPGLSLSAQSPDITALQGMGDVRYHRIDYSPLDQTYHIYVRLPGDYDPQKRYPVAYLLDGGITFPLLSAYYHYLRFGEEVPELIIAGISYGTSDWRKGNNRSRDFTVEAEERDHWGGAPDFVAFLRDSLFSLIENRYAADASRRIIFGQSLGGQFVLYAAQSEPGLFWGHIASNPALHRNLEYFLQTRPDSLSEALRPRVYVSSGSLDEPRFREPALKWMQFWTAQSNQPWALKTNTLEDHTHFSAAPEAFRRGMAWIFGMKSEAK